MSKLNIDQKTIKDLFSDKKTDFLIPDYQRPYAWGEEQCKTLWEDLVEFCIPGNDCSAFDNNEEYFLGSIVTFKESGANVSEVIDGQQRLTTLMLLLRAFYVKFEKMKDKYSLKTKENIEQCIWKTNEFQEPDKDLLKIKSEVATDDDKEEFLSILKGGIVNVEMKSRYAKNYCLFAKWIDKYISDYPTYIAYLATRILNNCIMLPVESESQDTALRIFSTLNDRGFPLQDADIFKAQFYKYFSDKDKKDEFIEKWKNLDLLCNKIFEKVSKDKYMDELFTRYMYYERAKENTQGSTTIALRKFYEKNKYSILKKEETFENLIDLADFWNCVYSQNDNKFSEEILKKFSILKYAPNGMWTYFVSVFYIANKNEFEYLKNDEKNINEEFEKKLIDFLDKSIGFIWTYQLINPGVNNLRTPIYPEMIKIVNNKYIDFKEFLFEENKIRESLNNYEFSNTKALTKSILIWWAYENKNQKLLNSDVNFNIEHIYSKKRNEVSPLNNADNIESLGNKVFLENKINIRASDYNFSDKVKYYKGEIKNRQATDISELLEMSENHSDFTEKDIENRKQLIIDSFVDYLRDNNLLKQ